MRIGYDLRDTYEKGSGIFATKTFTKGDRVMIGVIGRELKENHSHASQIAENKYILHAGLISKINHSCNPNCGIKVNDTEAHDIVARRTIEIDEEITFDYSMRNYEIKFFPKKCMCGSDNCRNKITGWKDLSNEKKNEYKGFAAPYLLELDKKRLKTAVLVK
ncbi:MAG: SET domain-containing protein-lysine N-methyltransferase [Spirochaetia bacterium]|nr:SET domain-containing protein-lysine N-methyltransferase [Spirochaetia bacterium]